jgi:hypothetical protein
MSTLSRREFLGATAVQVAALGVIAGPTRLRANPLGLPIGSQVYPHRALLKDLPAFCKTMADMGGRRLRVAGRPEAGEDDPRGSRDEGRELSLQHEGAAREAG